MKEKGIHSFYLLLVMNLKKCTGVGTPLYPKALLAKVAAVKDKGTFCKRFVNNMNKKYSCICCQFLNIYF